MTYPTKISISILQNPTQHLIILNDAPTNSAAGANYSTITSNINTTHKIIAAAEKGNLAAFMQNEQNIKLKLNTDPFKWAKIKSTLSPKEMEEFLKLAIQKFKQKGGTIQHIKSNFPANSQEESQFNPKLSLDELLTSIHKLGIPA